MNISTDNIVGLTMPINLGVTVVTGEKRLSRGARFMSPLLTEPAFDPHLSWAAVLEWFHTDDAGPFVVVVVVVVVVVAIQIFQ